MPISDGSRMLLEEALKQVRDEGYAVIGCYLNQNPQEIELVHFTNPTMARTALKQMVKCWLELLEDDSIIQEQVEPDNKPKLYQA